MIFADKFQMNMDTDHILDANLETSNPDSILDTIRWWENKRMVYNFIIGGLQIVLMIYYSRATIDFGIGGAIIWSLAFLLTANGLYSMGWAIEIFAIYHNFKWRSLIKSVRWVFLVLGFVFSIIVTLDMYLATLSYY